MGAVGRAGFCKALALHPHWVVGLAERVVLVTSKPLA
jgi:hypothetical protein|tara:strand:- start:415 stop:525 length:111 start_codon:yes stop_codon:yes gene_type:complete